MKSTRTSPFGSPGRINHDATTFYKSRLYQSQPKEKIEEYVENPVPAEILDTILCQSCERIEELPDSCIHLMVTSPPYNVGKNYDEDLSLEEYLSFLHRVWSQIFRVLVPGGRVCINIANLGRRPYIPLHACLIEDLLSIGFLMRGEIIWNKGSSSSSSTAWGSWRSARNPVLRDVHEYILIFSRGTYRRNDQGRPSTIGRDEFLEWTKSLWTFSAESAKKIGHPAPFPIELPHRLIQLYTFAGDVVLDPFMGSGQTALAAVKGSRHFIGYEINPDYVRLADERLKSMDVH